jgi:intein/homing endonuclease
MNIDHCNSHSSYLDKVNMSNLCVAGDTKITVKVTTFEEYDGTHSKISKTYSQELDIEIQQIEEILKEDVSFDRIEVLSYDIETGEKKWAPITDFAETSPKAKVMRITDEESGKSIIATPEHKVFTKNRGYVMAKDLTETDELVIN